MFYLGHLKANGNAELLMLLLTLLLPSFDGPPLLGCFGLGT